MKFKFTVIALLLLSFYNLKANDLSISAILPTNSEVCKSTSFGVIVENIGTDTTKDITIQLQFTAGLEYDLNSVSGVGATEFDVSNLNQPIFALQNLLVGEKDTLWFTATASCGLVSAINAGTIFTNTITANYTGGTKIIITQPFLIETALLVITNVTPIFIDNLIWDDQMTRTITIKNTRIGALTTFDFVDEHNGLLEMTSSLGVPDLSDPNEFRITLSGADFMTIGDGDTLFEINETIIITEQITIRSCGGNVPSNIKAQWGCGGTICQEDLSVAAIGVDISPYSANLEFRPTFDTDDCHCGNNAIPQQMIIKNTGDGEALFPLFAIRAYPAPFKSAEDDEINAIDPSSIQMTFNGTTTNPSPVYFLGTHNTCFSQSGLLRRAELALPNLAPGDSVIVDWNMYFCSDTCSNTYSGWAYDYSFTDHCPVGEFTLDTFNVVGEKTLLIKTLPLITSMADSSTHPFTYEIFDTVGVLQSPSGFVRVHIDLPCGLTWDDDPLDLYMGTKPPHKVVHDTTRNFIEVDYDLPLMTPTMDFSLKLDCSAPCMPSLDVLEVTTNVYLNDNCDTIGCSGIELCPRTWGINMECETEDTLCANIDTLAGGRIWDYQIERINFGLPDNNNDRQPDVGGSINLALVNENRAMMGDTIRESAGVKILDVFAQGFDKAKWETIWTSNFSGSGFYKPENFTMESNYFEIFDSSTNTQYTCPNLDYNSTFLVNSTNVDFQDSLSYHISLDPSYLATKCNVPANFIFEQGDSVYVENIYKIRYNFADDLPGTFNHTFANVVGTPRLYTSNNNYLPEYFHWCDTSDLISVSGYRIYVGLGQAVVRPCVDNDFSGLNSIFFLLAEDNFFPYEYREFVDVLSIGVLQDPNFQIDTSKVVSTSRAPATQQMTTDSEFLINSIGANGLQYFDLSPFQDTLYDEGFSYLLQHAYNGDCALTGNYPLEYQVGFQLSKELNDSVFTETRINGSGIRTLRPNLNISTGLQNITATSTSVEWEFDLVNNIANSGGLESDETFNTWVRPFSIDGTMTNFVLTNTVTNQTYNAINGIFQLGDLQKNELRELKITALNNGCDLETLRLYFGWNCSQYTLPNAPSCFIDSLDFTVQSIRPELEMSLTNPSFNTFALCTNIPYLTAKVFNAELGLADAIKLEAILPQGLSIVNGTCQMAYPDGNSFVNIPNPINVQGNIWQWDVSSLNATLQANGLKGVTDYPNNTFNLRFRLIADCDYISGSYVVLRALGDNQCNNPTNIISRTSNPIFINGAIPAYNSSISITMDTLGGCTNNLSTRVDITVTGTTGGTDSIFVSLPPNIDYVANSYSTIANASSNAPFIEIVDGVTVLKWQMNSGLSAGTTISFQFQTSDYSSFTCGEELLMFVQTVAPANATCVSSGQVCNILVSTGNAQHKTRVDRAKLKLSNLVFSVTPSGGQDLVRRSMTIQNNGAAHAPSNPIVIQYYHDIDGDGQITATDILLHTETKNLNIPSGGSWNLTTLDPGFLAPSGAYCNIIAVIDESMNCICSGSQIQSYTPTSYNMPLTQVCPNTDVTIGQAMQPSLQYQWLNNVVSCDTCSMNTVNLTNTGTTVAFQNYILQTTSTDGCVTNYDFTVSVNPVLSTSNDSLAVCLGDSVSLGASTANAYNWIGENITNSSAQNTFAMPTTSQYYLVNIIDNLNCTYTDSTWATVNTLPNSVAGGNQSICDNVTFTQMQAVFDPSYSYQWSPIGTITNPQIHNPIVFPTQTTVYTLLVTDGNGCQGTDNVTVFVAQSPAPTSENRSLCQGEILIYEGDTINQNGTYNYTLSAYNGCDSLHTLNISYRDTAFSASSSTICNGDTVIFNNNILTETGTYWAILAAENGCDSTVRFDLEVTDNILTTADTTLCPNETIEWNGLVYNAAGEYFQEFISESGCDSTHRLTIDYYNEMILDYPDSVEIPVGTSLDVLITGGLTYLWSPNDYLSCDNCSEPLVTPQSDILYAILVTDENGCNETINIKVSAPNTCLKDGMGIPNIITPNNDGVNDEFGVILPYGVERFSMRIYNRWGEKVFETTNPFEKWNGTRKEKYQTQESYVYVIEGSCFQGDGFYYTGSFLISN